MILVRFLRPWTVYARGECAAFTPDVAMGLFASGIAVDPDASVDAVTAEAEAPVESVADETGAGPVEPAPKEADAEGAPPQQGRKAK